MKPRLAVIASLLASLALAPRGQAHEWYSDKRDPVFAHSCCGGLDCGKLEIHAGMLTAEPGGYRIRLSLEETRKINPFSAAPVDALVTWDRIQPSVDGNYHICLMTFHRDNSRGGIYCFFAPPDS